MRSKPICVVLVAVFMGAGTACGGEGDSQRLPTSPTEEGGDEQEQEQEGGEMEQEGEGGE